MDFIQMKSKVQPKSSFSSGVIKNLGSDLILKIIQKQFFSSAFGFPKSLIQESRQKSLLHQFYWDFKSLPWWKHDLTKKNVSKIF